MPRRDGRIDSIRSAASDPAIFYDWRRSDPDGESMRRSFKYLIGRIARLEKKLAALEEENETLRDEIGEALSIGQGGRPPATDDDDV